MNSDTNWEGAGRIVERQTKQIEKEFGSSKPQPRARKMGFKPDPNVPVRQQAEYWRAYVRSDSW